MTVKGALTANLEENYPQRLTSLSIDFLFSEMTSGIAGSVASTNGAGFNQSGLTITMKNSPREHNKLFIHVLSILRQNIIKIYMVLK